MERLRHAASLTGLDFESMDTAFLVGGLAKLAAWYEAEKHLKALGKESICAGIRADGQKLIEQAVEPCFF
ncbi:hypothetical protein O7P02_004351, partial [Salmonella enterica]|nr:hypothetical protein [Salmonella enterica]